jgi:DNA-binding MarR family transcriptional regulator
LSRTSFQNRLLENASAQRRREEFHLLDFFPYHLTITAGIVAAEVAKRLENADGPTIPEWRVIAIVASFSPVSTNTISKYSAMNKVAVSRAVQKLIAKGYLRSEADEKDQRLLRIEFTALGKQEFERSSRITDQFSKKVLAGFSENEVERFKDFLRRVRSNAREK